MQPYRELALVPMDIHNKNIYRYNILDSSRCPICWHWILDCESGLKISGRRGKAKYCHPLRRVVVSGFWRWARFCPVPGTHTHIKCNRCNIKWIIPSKEKINYQVEEIEYG